MRAVLPAVLPGCPPEWRAYGSLAQEVGGARLAVENITDPPTQAVENITPWQKAPDMLCSQALADTQMASPAKCKLAVKSKKSRRAKKRSCWGSVCYGVIPFCLSRRFAGLREWRFFVMFRQKI